MTITEAARKATATRNVKMFNKVLDQMSERGNVMDIVMICDINACGPDGHKWAWNQLENWQDAE